MRYEHSVNGEYAHDGQWQLEHCEWRRGQLCKHDGSCDDLQRHFGYELHITLDDQ